jgi:hypothetical protein
MSWRHIKSSVDRIAESDSSQDEKDLETELLKMIFWHERWINRRLPKITRKVTRLIQLKGMSRRELV